ncbi:MAG: aminoacyl-tRNA hydrolase [bacterium]
MKLIVALGNPTKEYTNTRHNAGRIVLQELINKSDMGLTWNHDTFLKSNIIKLNLAGIDSLVKTESVLFKKIDNHFLDGDTSLILSFPTLFMNESGKSVLSVMKFYKLKPSDLLVIHDDLDVRLGKCLLQFSKGPKVHNGIKSIEELIGKDFWRLRVGVDNRDMTKLSDKNTPGGDYVLQNFSEEELGILKSLI